jgi:diphthine-ammonia ligase
MVYLFYSVLIINFPLPVAVESDELDSYMYQTVGHHAIDLYAEAMALPLYRRAIRGRSLETGRVYTQCEGDEVEDLYELLKLVKVCTVTTLSVLNLVIFTY